MLVSARLFGVSSRASKCDLEKGLLSCYRCVHEWSRLTAQTPKTPILPMLSANNVASAPMSAVLYARNALRRENMDVEYTNGWIGGSDWSRVGTGRAEGICMAQDDR